MTGRPSSFTQEIADVICEGIADGKSLRSICLADDMPSKSAVFRWLADDARQSFRDQYARAREAQADALFDEILSIADDGANDSYKDDEGRVKVDQDVIARSRLRVDARKWMAGKLRPKVYGDKIQTEHSGEMTVRSATDLKDDELAAIAAGSGG
jgi:hypothetical protein